MKLTALRILMIEDDAVDADLVRNMLNGSIFTEPEIDHFVNLRDAVSALVAEDVKEYDLILTDLHLPDSDGLDTLDSIRLANKYCPIIALTGFGDDAFGLETIRAGASDYIPKDQLNKQVLARAITYSIERNQFAGLKDSNRLLESRNERLAQMYSMSQQFVDNVSHEFRTPLTVIREFAAIIRDGIDGPVTGEQKRRLRTLINRTDDLAMMVDDLLDTSKLESGLLSTCRRETDLYSIIKQVHTMLMPRATAKEIELSIDLVPQGIRVFCDQEKLRRVLINLITNAIKFTPVEGSVEILVGSIDKNRTEVTVSDSGPGIPTDDLNRIFERFQQVGEHERMAGCKGFGLGLGIARSLAALNLGALRVFSQEGNGSQFSFSVPRYDMRSILNCYLDQRIQTVIGTGELSVTGITTRESNPGESEDYLSTVDEFLRTSVKCFDLTVQVSSNRWLVFSCTSAKTLPGLIQRLQIEWIELQRNHYGTDLPALVFEPLMTTPAEAGRQQLIEAAISIAECRPWIRDVALDDSSEVSASVTKGHVVVVDDESEVSNAIESRLSALGYEITTAGDGLAGLKAIKDTNPEVILMDIRMPKMDGLTALKRLKANPATQDIPVVVLSASLQDQRRALDAGASHFIQKPFKSEAVVSAIEFALQFV